MPIRYTADETKLWSRFDVKRQIIDCVSEISTRKSMRIVLFAGREREIASLSNTARCPAFLVSNRQARFSASRPASVVSSCEVPGMLVGTSCSTVIWYLSKNVGDVSDAEVTDAHAVRKHQITPHLLSAGTPRVCDNSSRTLVRLLWVVPARPNKVIHHQSPSVLCFRGFTTPLCARGDYTPPCGTPRYGGLPSEATALAADEGLTWCQRCDANIFEA